MIARLGKKAALPGNLSVHCALDLIERDLIPAPVVEPGCPHRLPLRDFKLATVLQIGGDAGGAERVASDPGSDSGTGTLPVAGPPPTF